MFRNDIAALRAFTARIASQFNIAYAANYTQYGGVDVKFIYDESKTVEFVGKPMILIQGTGDDSEMSSAEAPWRKITANATVLVTDFSGAQVGASNPTASDELIGVDFSNEILTNWRDWESLGMLEMKLGNGQIRTFEDQDKTPVRETNYTVTFHYQVGA